MVKYNHFDEIRYFKKIMIFLLYNNINYYFVILKMIFIGTYEAFSYKVYYNFLYSL